MNIFLWKGSRPQIKNQSASESSLGRAVGHIHVCMRVQAFQSCLILCDPVDCSQPGSFVHGDSPGKNTRAGCHFLLQRIFLTQGSNQRLLNLLHWQVGSLRHLGIFGHIQRFPIYSASPELMGTPIKRPLQS